MTQVRNAPHAAREGGPTAVHRLFAALIAEVEFFAAAQPEAHARRPVPVVPPSGEAR